MLEGVVGAAKDIGAYIGLLAAFVPAIWLVAEGLGSAFGWPKQRIAIVLGPLLGVIAYLEGFLPIFPSIFVEIRWLDITVGILWAALSGLFATFGAKVVNDRIAKPVGLQAPKRKKGDKR